MAFQIKYDKDGLPIASDSVVAPETQNTVEAPQQDIVQVTQLEEEVEEQNTEKPTEQESEQETVIDHQSTETIKNQAVQESFRALREKAERAEQEKNELRRLLKEAQEKTNIVNDEDIKLGDDDFAEGKHLKQLQQTVKKLKQDAEQNRHQAMISATEIRLKSQFPDFDRIVSATNIESLRNQYPELAASVNSNQDLYTKAVSAYTMIKKLGISQEDNFIEAKAQTIKNAAKPKPLASISPQKGDTPLSHANAFASGLTPELQAQLIREMNESRKGY